MRAFVFSILKTILFSACCCGAETDNLASVLRELKRPSSNILPDRTFTVRGRLSFRWFRPSRPPSYELLGITDGEQELEAFNLSQTPASDLHIGDILRLSGRIDRIRIPEGLIAGFACTNIDIVQRCPAPTPKSVSSLELSQRTPDNARISVRGKVIDACFDGFPANWVTIIIEDQGINCYLALQQHPDKPIDISAILGATVSAVGIHNPAKGSARQTVRRNVIAVDSLDDITILCPPETIEDLPANNVENYAFAVEQKPSQTRQLTASGTVIATWDRRHLMLRTVSGKLIRGELSQPNLPACGDPVRLVGYPETDFYLPFLTRATWQKTSSGECVADTPSHLPLDAMSSDAYGIRRFNPLYYGKYIRCEGTVVSLPVLNGNNVLYLTADGQLVAVNVSTLKPGELNADIGSRISVVGICVMQTEKATSSQLFPSITGYQIVVRNAQDIRVISRPPWWTPLRIWTAFSILAAALLAILIWNLSLRILVERRGHQLLQGEIEAVKSKLQIEERTRLAVELHDTLAQNLTGVSMEIEAANDLRGNAPKTMTDHLSIAAKALKSSRDELRNCLWDLRSQALDEKDMTAAILRTLQPHVNDSRLSVRFNVPRSHLSDNTAHAILRIIRELVVNAIRHGSATAVKVAGTIDSDKLLCSVTDNGQGFDPDSAPGILQGHFGLQGIRERIDELSGEFTLVSSPGKGTKATITVPIPREVQKSKEVK